MNRRFFDANKQTHLYLAIHSPGLYLYRGKPLGTKALKALNIHEAPVTAKEPKIEPLKFADPQAEP